MRPWTMTRPARGEVWDVDFAPAVGAEIQKIRPAIVMNVPEVGRLPLAIVVPVTEWQPEFGLRPWFVPLVPAVDNGLYKKSGADAFQVKSVSLNRFVGRRGILSATETDRVTEAIALCVGA